MSVRQVGADCRSARSIVLSWSYGRLVQYWFNKEEEEEEEEEKEKKKRSEARNLTYIVSSAAYKTPYRPTKPAHMHTFIATNRFPRTRFLAALKLQEVINIPRRT